MITTGLQRTELDNGLIALTRETHTAPVTSFWIWYRVGSRNERPGLTGLSHWVEHMLFKGTPSFPQGEYDRLVQREGGFFNGMTWLDWTTYYETLPADRIELALRIESDRMTHSLFEPEEVERERTVILSEREGNENRPTYLLFEQVQGVSFLAHPYRHMVIGLKEDLRRIRREDLYAHYRRYYAPNNAIAAVVGDFETEAMLDRIQHYFGDIPRGPEIDEIIPDEPPPRAERRVRMEGAGGATYLRMSFRGPRAQDEDFFPMVVLDALLSGPKGMPPFGGGGFGRSARLYRALVNEGLAISVHSSFSATIDPYLFTISVTARPERSPAEVEDRVLAELKRLQDEPVDETELTRAIKGARAQLAYGMESVTNQAMWLGFAEIVASVEWLSGFLDSLARVRAEDVQRVARTYLRSKNRVVGWYVARGEA